jgi:hypothetical protein
MPAVRPSIVLSVGLIAFAPMAIAADNTVRATQACEVVYRASPDASPIIWSSGEDGRVVLYTANGERIECSFVTGDSPVPQLSSLQSTAADRSVAVLSGKSLDKDNRLVVDYFKTARGSPQSP